MRIVIVDNEVRTRINIGSLIYNFNREFQVIGDADNGYDGMLLIRSLLPDLVITDISLPRVNGLDMIEIAKECSPKTQYLVFSDNANFDSENKETDLPSVDYLAKPISSMQLAEALYKVNNKLTGHEKKEPCEVKVNKYLPFVNFIVNDIKENYAQKLRLDKYARKFKVSEEYVGMLFHKETGKSFCAYLRDIRMKKAQELIENTDFKIYEIAFRTGFSDPKYFCKVFKNYNGVSAKSYVRIEQ